MSSDIGIGDANFMRSTNAVMKRGNLQNDTPLVDSKMQNNRASMHVQATAITSRVEIRHMYATGAQIKSEATRPSWVRFMWPFRAAESTEVVEGYSITAKAR